MSTTWSVKDEHIKVILAEEVVKYVISGLMPNRRRTERERRKGGSQFESGNEFYIRRMLS